MSGLFIGVGVGPGDPELLTLKAFRAIQAADVICYLQNQQGQSQARDIAIEALRTPCKAQRHIAIAMQFSQQRHDANRAYDAAMVQIHEALDAELQVVFLCEGDALFFGSFNYLLERVNSAHPVQVIPGIPAFIAATAELQKPLAVLKQSFAVITGRHSDDKIKRALREHDALVIMKAGMARPRLLRLLQETDRLGDGNYLEYIGRDEQQIVTDLEQLDAQAGPYFSLFVITREVHTQ